MLILIHYSEIGLKGGNRSFFEDALLNNIRKSLSDVKGVDVRKTRDRVFCSFSQESDRDIVLSKLKKVFGIANFSFVEKMLVTEDAEKIFAEIYKSYMTYKSDRTYKTFRVSAKRSDKNFPLNSQQLNEQIGALIANTTKMKVCLDNPDIVFYIEVSDNKIYFYFEKIKGPGGLPVGVSGDALSFISSGIDSPVASWRLMKRGAKVDFVHFHGYPKTGRAAIDNVKQIVKKLSEWQNVGAARRVIPAKAGIYTKNDVDSHFHGNDTENGNDGGIRLYLIPFLDVQQDIIKKAPEDYRVVMYRHFMTKIAERLVDWTPNQTSAEASDGSGQAPDKTNGTNKTYQTTTQTNYKAFVTGESLAQVASQTLDNMYALMQAREGKMPVLRPLIGMDKEEIIKEARAIETYEISIKPYDDCCAFFVPAHPVTKAREGRITEIAKKVDVELVDRALRGVEVLNF